MSTKLSSFSNKKNSLQTSGLLTKPERKGFELLQKRREFPKEVPITPLAGEAHMPGDPPDSARVSGMTGLCPPTEPTHDALW